MDLDSTKLITMRNQVILQVPYNIDNFTSYGLLHQNLTDCETHHCIAKIRNSYCQRDLFI